jgi:hypothetical protein
MATIPCNNKFSTYIGKKHKINIKNVFVILNIYKKKTKIMNCDNIGIKCKVKHLILEPLYEFRRKNPGKLGKIGDIEFQEVSIFFDEVQEGKKVKYLYTNKRCISFGDIHGDFLVLLSLLNLAHVIDDRGAWIGLDTIVVFTGDLLDRAGRLNPSSGYNTSQNTREEVDIVQYLYFLHLQAKKQNGAVLSIVGNHEIARVFWESMPKFQRFIGDQKDGWGKNMNYLFSPGGKMAKFMARNYPFIVKVNNFVFMHGGPTPNIINKLSKRLGSPQEVIPWLNKKLFEMFDKPHTKISNSVMTLAEEREFSKPSKHSIFEKECEQKIKLLLQNIGVEDVKRGAFVIGHSIQSKIETYCNKFVWRLDLAMSEAFGRKVQGLHPLGGILITFEELPRVTSFQTYAGSEEIIVTMYDKKEKSYSVPCKSRNIFFGINLLKYVESH